MSKHNLRRTDFERKDRTGFVVKGHGLAYLGFDEVEWFFHGVPQEAYVHSLETVVRIVAAGGRIVELIREIIPASYHAKTDSTEVTGDMMTLDEFRAKCQSQIVVATAALADAESRSTVPVQRPIQAGG